MLKYALSACAALVMLSHGGGIAFAQDSEPQDWSVQCNRTNCIVVAEARLQNGALFHQIRFEKVDSDLYAGIMKLPLGIHIPSGVQIGIDDDALIEAKIVTCTSEGCEAVFNANETVVNFFKRGRQMSVALTNNSDRKKLAVNYSLMGFTKNWEEFRKRMNVLLP